MTRFATSVVMAELWLLLTSPVSAASPAPAVCVPDCRPGFVCHQGACVSACNPVCPANEACTPQGDCVSRCNPACPASQVCTPAGTCVSRCNPPCPGGQTCQGDGTCRPIGGATTAGPGGPAGPGPFVVQTQPPAMERKDHGMYIGGIVAMGVGGAAIIAGIAVMVSSINTEEVCTYGTGDCWRENDEDGMASGGGVLGLGLAVLTTGAILTAIGGKRVPVGSVALDDGPRLSIQPTLGGVHATLDF